MSRPGEKRALWTRRHAGHHITTTPTGRRACRTCPINWPINPDSVARVLDGAPGDDLTIGERRVVVPILRARGLTGDQIADRVGCSDRTVWRILTTARQAAA